MQTISSQVSITCSQYGCITFLLLARSDPMTFYGYSRYMEIGKECLKLGTTSNPMLLGTISTVLPPPVTPLFSSNPKHQQSRIYDHVSLTTIGRLHV